MRLLYSGHVDDATAFSAISQKPGDPPSAKRSPQIFVEHRLSHIVHAANRGRYTRGRLKPCHRLPSAAASGRNEDARIAHRPRVFVDDGAAPGMLHVRSCAASSHTNADERRVSAARARDGVVACTRPMIRPVLQAWPDSRQSPPIPAHVFHPCTQLPLAKGGSLRRRSDRMIVASKPLRCRGPLADVIVDIEPIDAVVALKPR